MSAFRISLLNFMYSCLFFFFIVVTFQDRLAVECLVPGGTGVCTKILSNIDVYPSLRVQAQKVQFTKPCGWNTCNAYKIVFVPVYYTESRAVYREELVCCPGYESIDNNNSCKELLILGGTEPPRRPGRPGHQGPGQPNGPPSNPNGPSWPGNPNVPRGPGLPGGRGNEGNPFGPNPDSPNSPGSNSNPSFGADNVPIVPIQPQNPLDPASPNAPNTPVRPGSPSNPGPTSSGPIGPGGPGASGNPVGPGSPNVQPNPSSPNFPGDSFSPNGPVIPDTIPGSQTERHGPFNPQPPLNPQQPFDPYDPVYPRDDSMNRGGSNSRTNTKFGQDGKIPDSHGNNNRKDTKYDDDGTEKEENYAPSDSKGSVLVIFGVMMLVMALFGLGAFGMAYMRKRVNMHEELEEETPRVSIIGSDKDQLMPSDSVQQSARPHTASPDGPVTGRVNSVSKVSTCTDNDTDSGIVRISITDETLPDEYANTSPWKNPETRRMPARNKLRLELKTKFASFLGPYSFTDLRSIHEDTPQRLSSASSERCLCNLPPNICPRPHSPVRKTANFFSSNESLPQDPPELMAYAYTAVDPTVGLCLSKVLNGKRNSLPVSEACLTHEYKQLERYNKMNTGEEILQKRGYDKLNRSESSSVKPELKPKPRVGSRNFASSGSSSEVNVVRYNMLSRGAEQIISKSPTMETSYGKLDDDRSSIKPVPSTKPKPVFSIRRENISGANALKGSTTG